MVEFLRALLNLLGDGVKRAWAESLRDIGGHVRAFLLAALASFLVLGFRGDFDVISLFWAAVIGVVMFALHVSYNLLRGPVLAYEQRGTEINDLKHSLEQLGDATAKQGEELEGLRTQYQQQADFRRQLGRSTDPGIFEQLRRLGPEGGEEKSARKAVEIFRDQCASTTREMRQRGYELQARQLAAISEKVRDDTPRPELYEIIRCWQEQLKSFVVSGELEA